MNDQDKLAERLEEFSDSMVAFKTKQGLMNEAAIALRELRDANEKLDGTNAALALENKKQQQRIEKLEPERKELFAAGYREAIEMWAIGSPEADHVQAEIDEAWEALK